LDLLKIEEAEPWKDILSLWRAGVVPGMEMGAKTRFVDGRSVVKRKIDARSS
jgi:hypothetical protein